jgi:hypothetical protein
VIVFEHLRFCHAGEVVCVMGGGPNLGADLARLADAAAAIWISANHHGAALREVDYVVALDDEHDKLRVPMRGLIREHTAAPIIAPHPWADIVLDARPDVNLTGPMACWVASQMGARQIILVGFDCYGGLGGALALHRKMAPHIACDVRVVSGPLLALYPAWQEQAAA